MAGSSPWEAVHLWRTPMRTTESTMQRWLAPMGPLRRWRRCDDGCPHDVTNALAASALVLETGLANAARRCQWFGNVRRSARTDWNALRRSTASIGTTTPRPQRRTAATAAIRSFERIVLIAGGADKGVALSSMAAEPERFSGVIGLGATAPHIVELFIAAGVNSERVVDVQTLERAVTQAAEWAGDGDVVLLSPGCASLDQFPNFEVRGDTFRRLVAALSQEVSA